MVDRKYLTPGKGLISYDNDVTAKNIPFDDVTACGLLCYNILIGTAGILTAINLPEYLL